MTYKRKDAHYARARAEGYRARSAFKLIELNRRYRLLRPGGLVVDLGCWPGSWLQVSLEAVGARGRVVGVDVTTPEPMVAGNLSIVSGDIRDSATIDAIRRHVGGGVVDVVLSDLAPKLTGVRATDEARADELTRAALSALPVLLRVGGAAVAKVFMNAHYEALARDFRACFARSHATRAEATRRGSTELYLVGLGYTPEPSAGCGQDVDNLR